MAWARHLGHTLLTTSLLLVACGGDDDDQGSSGSGGVAAGGSVTGGEATGGATGGSAVGGTGGLSTGGTPTGGTPPAGGATTGGLANTGGTPTGGVTTTGGAPMGGAPTGGGGTDTGGAGTGGTDTGGAGTGGAPTGGAPTGGASTGQSPGCGTTPTISSDQYNNGQPISISAANMQRRYILSVPDNYDNTHPYKLIIAWHQLDGNDVQMYNNGYYHLRDLSGGSAIFVAPNGQKNGQPCSGTGNGDGGCGWPNGNGSDMALSDAVVNELKENFCIDTNRIFATGWSYGGSMSYANACERPLGGSMNGVDGYIRAAAIYSGAVMSPFGGCAPSDTPVAYYASHGTGDSVLTYDGGVSMAQNWANVNGCNWTTPARATGSHICTEMTGCTEGYPVTFCSFNGPHTPDPSDGGGGSWQYQVVWDFFDQF